MFFCKIPSLASGTSLLSFSLFMGPVLKFHSAGTSLMKNFDIYFSQRWSFLFPDTRMTLRRLSESYSFELVPRLRCMGFPRDFLSWETSVSESCDTQPNCDTLFTIATAFLSSLSLFGWSCSFSAFYLVGHQPCNAETDTYLQRYNPFHFCSIDTRADANIHKTFTCKYLSNNICTVVEEWNIWLLLPRILLFLDTLRPRDKVGSESVAAVCSGFCARSWASWRELHRSPCEHWPFSFHWQSDSVVNWSIIIPAVLS